MPGKIERMGGSSLYSWLQQNGQHGEPFSGCSRSALLEINRRGKYLISKFILKSCSRVSKLFQYSLGRGREKVEFINFPSATQMRPDHDGLPGETLQLGKNLEPGVISSGGLGLPY